MAGLALVTTVRNEATSLRPNLLYHHHLGVERAYVYLDATTDGTGETVADLDWVRVAPTVDPAPYADDPATALFATRFDDSLPARQCCNVVDALDRAGREGFEWLVHLDPDELAVTDPHRSEAGSLASRLASLPPSVEAAKLAVVEAVQSGDPHRCVAIEETRFKRPGTGSTRPVPDPRHGTVLEAPVVYGHAAGKSAVRVGPGVLPRSAHAFGDRDGRRLVTHRAGLLAHYYAHDAADFLNKFRNTGVEPASFLTTAIPAHRRLWSELVNDQSIDEAELVGYFRTHLAFSAADLASLARRRWTWRGRGPSGLVELTAPRQAFLHLGLCSPA